MTITFSGGFNLSGGVALKFPPEAPTIGTASYVSTTSASVAFTPPPFDGGDTITSYTVTSTPGGFTATGTSSPIAITGLTTGPTYTYTVYATNGVGNSPESASSNSVITVEPASQSEWTTPGTYTWTVPDNVTSISIVAVGGGMSGGSGGYNNSAIGGAGGSLAYRNNYSVTPGQVLDIVVGAGGVTTAASGTFAYGSNSTVALSGTYICFALRGQSFTNPGVAGQVIYPGGSAGAASSVSPPFSATNGGGGGAGGYSGNGGAGGSFSVGYTGKVGTGGGGGGGTGGTSNARGYGGGGVGIYGQGADGTANGGGGSGGSNAYLSGTNGQGGMGGAFGGGGGGSSTTSTYKGGDGGGGAVRIIWPGSARQFPSTRTANE